MIGAKVGKILAMLGILAGTVHGLEQVGANIETIVELPQRFVTYNELKTLFRQVAYDSTDGENAIRPDVEPWLADRLTVSAPRKAGCDLWGTRFQFFDAVGKELRTVPTVHDAFAIASAGPDRKFNTRDDVVVTNKEVSMKETQLEMKELMKAREKARAASKSDTGRAPIGDTMTEESSGIEAALDEAMAELKVFNDREPSRERRRYDPLARVKKLGEW